MEDIELVPNFEVSYEHVSAITVRYSHELMVMSLQS